MGPGDVMTTSLRSSVRLWILEMLYEENREKIESVRLAGCRLGRALFLSSRSSSSDRAVCDLRYCFDNTWPMMHLYYCGFLVVIKRFKFRLGWCVWFCRGLDLVSEYVLTF